MDLDEARAFAAANPRAVLATYRHDGRAQMTPISCSVHPDGAVEISGRETAFKVRNLRRDPRASLCVLNDRFFGPFAQLEGRATIVSLPDAMDGLVEYYRRLAGEHPDWDDYRATMVREQRVLVRIELERAGPAHEG